MGDWLVRYFSKTRISLLVYDIRSEPSHKRHNIKVCKSLVECVVPADIVIICVPLDETQTMIEKCVPIMHNGATLIEIASIKSTTYTSLKRVNRRINLLSIHPMFGPGAVRLTTQKILMIPVKNKRRELNILRALFSNIKIIIVNDWKLHDKYMSMLLSLAYYINLVFAECLTDQNVPVLKSLSGSSFAIQSLLSESMLTDEPAMISSLFTENPFAVDLIRKYNHHATALTRYITDHNKKEIKSLILEMKGKLSKDIDFDRSYRKVYDILDAIPSRRIGKQINS